MRESALRLLRCPACGGGLVLDELTARTEREDDGHVMTGTLVCVAADAGQPCGTRYPIRGGVPRLLPPGSPSAGGSVEAEGRAARAQHAAPARAAAPAQEAAPVRTAGVDPEAAATAERFGQQWKTFTHMAPYQEAWLRAWLDPLGPEDFRGRTVYEAGCGKGRHSVVIASWGARDLVAVDLSESVDVAFAHTRDLPAVHVVQGDILHPPTAAAAFDVAFSIGVLHHLPDPRAGFAILRTRVAPGGRIAAWVYGRENNEWIVRFVNPVREHVTSRLPARALYWLSLPASAALAATLVPYRTPRVGELAGRVGIRLPYRDYLAKLATVPLREVHNIVFDQLVTPIAFYLPEAEVRSWVDGPGLADVSVAWHNRNSWRVSARVVG